MRIGTIRFRGVEMVERRSEDPARAAGYAVYDVSLESGSRSTIKQPFSTAGVGEDPVMGQPIWEWDGNEKRPTLKPSFQADFGGGARVHFHLTAGVIVPCPDHALEVLA